MKRKLQGKYVRNTTVGANVRAYVPAPLPPKPPINWTPALQDKHEKALLALGRLDSVSRLLPDTVLFLYMFVRKEAVLSSQIEGTQSSLSDLLLVELDLAPGVPIDDVQAVSNYVKALFHGLKRLAAGFPISLRLIREVHKILLSKGRGSDQEPGEFRRSQNWIGGTRPGNAHFVPPPVEYLADCLGKLELFLHDKPESTTVLVKAGLSHVQFETIHPFLDGNGRIGRLLITLLLCSKGVLKEPLLYLSLYFKNHRQRYYDLLDNVRQTGDWESWLAFFFDAVAETASQTVETSDQLVKLATEDTERIKALGRKANSVSRVLRAFFEYPITTGVQLALKTQLSRATVNSCIRELEQLGVIGEITGQKRNRVYSYTNYIGVLNQGTEIIA